MAQIAQKDEYVIDGDGIRRKIVAGSVIPDHLAAQMDVETETVETRTLREVVVDEEASLSQAERAAAGGSTIGVPTGSPKKAAKRAAGSGN